MLALSFNTVSLHNVVIVMSALEGSLHLSELMLHSIKLYTSIFTRLTHFAYFFLFLSKLKVDTLVFVCQLFGKGILKPDHQDVVSREEGLTTVVEVLVDIVLFLLVITVLVLVGIVVVVLVRV